MGNVKHEEVERTAHKAGQQEWRTDRRREKREQNQSQSADSGNQWLKPWQHKLHQWKAAQEDIETGVKWVKIGKEWIRMKITLQMSVRSRLAARERERQSEQKV